MTCKLKIRTIDITKIEENTESFIKAANDIYEECVSTGFFLLKIPDHVTDQVPRVMEAAKTFFGLSLKQKMELQNNEISQMRIEGTVIPGTGSGYRGFASDPNFKSDARESYNIGPDVDPELVVSAGYSGSGVTLWPGNAAIPGWRKTMLKYLDSLLAISDKLKKLFAASLGLRSEFFETPGYFDKATWLLGLVRYPDTKSRKGSGTCGIKPHCDSGMFTLLLGDGNPGLQVCLDKNADAKDRVWLDVEPAPNGHLIVNLGQALERWSGGKFKATMHRVMLDGIKNRFSVPFFYDPNIDCVLNPLVVSQEDSLNSKLVSKSLGQMMLERLKKIDDDFE